MKKPWWIDDILLPLLSIIISIAFAAELILFAVNSKPIHFQWAVILALLLVREDIRETKKV